MTEYIASFKDSVQISPDEFDVTIKMFHCDENTTLGEVFNWAKRTHKYITCLTITKPELLEELDDKPF